MSFEDRITNAQRKAVEDDDNGEFDPPETLVSEVFASENDMKVNDAYVKEWKNHHEQTK